MSAQDILVLAEVREGTLADASLELLTAGCALAAATGGKLLTLVLGPDGAAQAASLGAADRILIVDDPQLAAYSPEPYVAAIQEVILGEQPRAVLIAATSIGWDVAPLLSARLDVPLVTGCKEFQANGEGLRVTASFCGGKMMAECHVAVAPAVFMVQPGSYRPSDKSGNAEIQPRRLAASLAPGAIGFEQWILPEAGDIDITQHDILVAVGRGIQQKDNLELAENLARVLGGVVSRLPAGRRSGLAALDAASGEVGDECQTKALPGVGHQWCARASGRDEGRRVDHRREYRRQGADLRHRTLRRASRRVGLVAGTERSDRGQERVAPWILPGPSCGTFRTGRRLPCTQ